MVPEGQSALDEAATAATSDQLLASAEALGRSLDEVLAECDATLPTGGAFERAVTSDSIDGFDFGLASSDVQYGEGASAPAGIEADLTDHLDALPVEIEAAPIDGDQIARSHAEFGAAIDEAAAIRRQAAEFLNHSRVQAQEILDNAQRRAIATVGQCDDEAAEIVDAARTRASAIVEAAQRQADELMASTTVEADGIRQAAERAAKLAIEEEREAYKAKATQITESAIADSRRLVALAEGQADDLIQGATALAAERRAEAEEAARAIAQEASDKLAAAERDSAEILERARLEADAAGARVLADADVVREEAALASQQLLADAESDAAAMRGLAQEELEAAELVNSEARERVASAIQRATEDTSAKVRANVEAQLIDSRREAALIEEQAAAKIAQADLDAQQLLTTAAEEANLIRTCANLDAKATVDEANAVLARANERASAMTQEAMDVAATIQASAQDQIDDLLSSGQETYAELVSVAKERVRTMLERARIEADEITRAAEER